MIRPVIHLCLVLTLGCGQIALAAPTHDEILAWVERNTDATTLDEPLGEIGVDGLDRLKPYLSPGLFDEFNFADLEMEVEATQAYAPHAVYLRATTAFHGQATLGDGGSLLGLHAGRFANRAGKGLPNAIYISQ